MPSPQFKHDCENCIFLGHSFDRDLYYDQHTESCIARYGNYGNEYESMPISLVENVRHFADGDDPEPSIQAICRIADLVEEQLLY